MNSPMWANDVLRNIKRRKENLLPSILLQHRLLGQDCIIWADSTKADHKNKSIARSSNLNSAPSGSDESHESGRMQRKFYAQTRQIRVNWKKRKNERRAKHGHVFRRINTKSCNFCFFVAELPTGSLWLSPKSFWSRQEWPEFNFRRAPGQSVASCDGRSVRTYALKWAAPMVLFRLYSLVRTFFLFRGLDTSMHGGCPQNNKQNKRFYRDTTWRMAT